MIADLFEEIQKAKFLLKNVALQTPFQRHQNLSEQFKANIYLKREDLQVIRSYKLRGAYNKISNLSKIEQQKGVICASAGNHSQGVAYSCALLKIHGKIVMPITTPAQKVRQAQFFGKEFVQIILHGDTFDDAYKRAREIAEEEKLPFIHPFDDEKVIAGQGTVGLEILENTDVHLDYLFVPIGGGGLAAGICTIFKHLSPLTKIIGVEPLGAPSMKKSIEAQENITLEQIDKFVDGASVKRVGDITFSICKDYLFDVLLVPEGKVCSTILQLYNEDAIVVEPAGALTIAALSQYQSIIAGKNVACVVSGSNNDITRMEEIKERSLLYEGLKHYFIVRFPQRPGALKEYVNEVLKPGMDISYFQYAKKNNREQGPTVVGIELQQKEDFSLLISSMEKNKINFRYLNEDSDLYTHLIGF